MKRLILILCILIMASAISAQSRLQLAGRSMITSGEEKRESIHNFTFGFSHKMGDVGDDGAAYGVVLGKYGEAGKVKGAGLEVVWFPVRPSGKGFRLFFPTGVNVTQVDMGEIPVTYIQAASGIGGYYEFSPATAIWGAFKIESSEKLTTLDLAIGLSMAIFE